MGKTASGQETFDYDVCLSFAGEERTYVERVASYLRSRGVRVFYDQYERTQLWGKDLYQHLDDVYQNAARYCVLFASKNYAKRLWTNHELRSAQARALRGHREYILPARFDNTEIPGLPKTIGFTDLRITSAETLAGMIIEKLGAHQNTNFFPPCPDKLFTRLRRRTASEKGRVRAQAYDFFRALQRMTLDERRIVLLILHRGCPGELPQYVHLELGLLKRLSGFPRSKIVRLLSGVRSLGFLSSVESSHHAKDDYLGKPEDVMLRWYCSISGGGYATHIADAVVSKAVDGYCEECGLDALLRLDFSQLCSATWREHKHPVKRRTRTSRRE